MVSKGAKPTAGPMRTDSRYAFGDHFGLAGLDLQNDNPVPVDPWITELRTTLEQRWAHVEDLKRRGKLRAALSRSMGKKISDRELEIWYGDARDDHRWRIRLLNPKTKEGKLYRGLMNYYIHRRLAAIVSRLSEVIDTLAYLLDLNPDFPGEPSVVPVLRGLRTFPSNGIVPLFEEPNSMRAQILGIQIPRRYTKARARRAMELLFERRDEDHWRRIAEPVVAIMDQAMQYSSKKSIERLCGGPGSLDLVLAIRENRSDLSNARRPRKRYASIDGDQVAKARELAAKWQPAVIRYLKAKSGSSRVSQRLAERIERARLKQSRPSDILLQMAIDELGLGIGVVGLRRLIKRSADGDS